MEYVDYRGGRVRFLERRGGRGANFFYFGRDDGVLVPVHREGSESYIRESGTGKKFVVRVSDEEFTSPRTMYEVRVSHASNVTVYKRAISIVDGELRIDQLEPEPLEELDFALLGDEEWWVNRYRSLVPEIVQRVKTLQAEFGFEFEFSEGARRTREFFREPEYGLRMSLMFSTENSRVQSLKQKLGVALELFGLTELIAATVDPEDFTAETLRFSNTSESPVAILRMADSWVTVWRHFPLRESMGRRPAGQLSPDFVLFEGMFTDQEAARERAMDSAIIVEMKMTVSGAAIDQLVTYAEVVPRGTQLVLGCYDLPDDPPDEVISAGWVLSEVSLDSSRGFCEQISSYLP